MATFDHLMLTMQFNVADHWRIILQYIPKDVVMVTVTTPRPLNSRSALTMTLLVVLSPLVTSQKCTLMIPID